MFALGVPALIMLVGLAVGLNVRESEQRIPRLAIDNSTPSSAARMLFIASLISSPRVHAAVAREALAELRDGKVDAVLSFPDGDATLQITLSPGALGEKTTDKIEETVDSARTATFSQNPGLKNKPPLFLQVFDIKTNALSHSNAYLVQIVMIFVALFLYRVGDSVSFAAQNIWLAEPRAKSLLNLLVLPINRYALVAAKCTAMIILSFASVVAYQLGFVLSVLLMALVTPHVQAASGAASSALDEALDNLVRLGWLPFTELLVVVFLMFACFCAAISLIVIAMLKEKQVGMVLGWILTATLIPILLIFYPSMELNSMTQFVPLLNMVALLKAALLNTMSWYQPWVVLIEMGLISAGLFMVGIMLIGQERFLLNSLE